MELVLLVVVGAVVLLCGQRYDAEVNKAELKKQLNRSAKQEIKDDERFENEERRIQQDLEYMKLKIKTL